jgi:hypothetical protein
MTETQPPDAAKLYHGTSSRAAVEIIGSWSICPAASSPALAKRYSWPTALRHRPDQKCVYLIPRPHEAVMFGMVRSVGMKWRNGQYKVNPFSTRKDYDGVVIFELNADVLDPSLVRKSDLYRNEVAYDGVIELGESVTGVEFPMTRELYEFARDIQTPGLLRNYIGMDLTEYLHGEPFELVRTSQ